MKFFFTQAQEDALIAKTKSEIEEEFKKEKEVNGVIADLKKDYDTLKPGNHILYEIRWNLITHLFIGKVIYNDPNSERLVVLIVHTNNADQGVRVVEEGSYRYIVKQFPFVLLPKTFKIVK